jgi:hypothetical protein
MELEQNFNAAINQNSGTDNQNSGVSKTRPKDLQERWGIGKDAYYDMLKHTNIKAHRDKEGAWLDDEQVETLTSLRQHIEQTGKMEGFGALVKSEAAEIDQVAETINVDTDTSNSNQEQFTALVRGAAEYAAGMEIAKYMLVKEIQENPGLLPEDLRSQVEEARKAVAPKSQSPQSVANQFMNQFRRGQAVA